MRRRLVSLSGADTWQRGAGTMGIGREGRFSAFCAGVGAERGAVGVEVRGAGDEIKRMSRIVPREHRKNISFFSSRTARWLDHADQIGTSA